MDGFKDAEAFENSFYYKKRGRRDFEKDFPHACGNHLYGWMATKKVCFAQSDGMLRSSEHFSSSNFLRARDNQFAWFIFRMPSSLTSGMWGLCRMLMALTRAVLNSSWIT